VIQLPKRSVTRFFVPLIDVLILLFCIFLLMPFVSQPGQMDNPAGTDDPNLAEPLPVEVTTLQRDLQKAQQEIKKYQARLARGDQAENLSVRVLEIDKSNGRLFYHDPDRKEILNEGDAQLLIIQHSRVAGLRQPFFLILFPRELSGYPEEGQVETYRKWFSDVKHGFDNPLANSPAP